MFNETLHRMEVGGVISHAVCKECRHPFKDGDDLLITSALCKVENGKLIIDDHAPTIICFPVDSDGHYSDNQNS